MKKAMRLLCAATLVLVLAVGAAFLTACGGSAERPTEAGLAVSEEPVEAGLSAVEDASSASRPAESLPFSEPAQSTPVSETNDTADSSATNNLEGDNVMVEITMKDGGVIRLELNSEAAPITVKNFVSLVEDEFYDGLIFHRIIPGFMIQGGDPEGTGMGGSDENIKGEFAKNGWDNPISHVRGVISMARSQDPDSASSQFFITHGDSTFLDGDYAAFGTVVEGMDVVDAIANVRTGANDRPVEDVVIDTIRIVE